MTKYRDFESQDLVYKLLPGEERVRVARGDVSLHCSRIRSVADTAKGTVVLLHGVASNGSRWEEFVETTDLRQDWDIIRMDLRGHAASVCRQKTRLEDWSEDLNAVLDAFGVERAVVIGHSLGAQVAMHYTAHNAERVLALGLLDPLIEEALTQKALDKRKLMPVVRVVESVTRRLNRLGFIRRLAPQDLRAMDARARDKIEKGGKELEEFIEEYSSTKADLQYIHLATYSRDLLEVARPSPAPELLTVPTLVIGSSSGTFTDDVAMAEWVAKLPNARMRTVTCAHWPMTECPAEVSKVISDWVVEEVLS